jgi:hypothetical protein
LEGNAMDIVPLEDSLLFEGDNGTAPGYTAVPSSNLTVTFDDTGTGSSSYTLGYLTVINYTSVTINSNCASSVTGGANNLHQLAETDNDLTTVTIKGSQNFNLGSTAGGEANADDGVVTDTGAIFTIFPTTIVSSLTTIDASATTGAVKILAGATNTNGVVTITYTGLTIKAGSGQDFIENDATNGSVYTGLDAASGDTIILGGATAKTTDWGSDTTVIVGSSLIGTPELPGTACGDMVSLNAPGGELQIGKGAEAGSTAGTAAICQTLLQRELLGTTIDFKSVTSSSYIANEDSAVTSASSVTAAENAAVKALGAAGVAFFTFGSSEYFIATNHTETAVSPHDAVVVVGQSGYWATDTGGLVTLTHLHV